MRTYKTDCPEIELKLKRGEVKKMQIRSSVDCYQALKYFFDQDTIELTETFIVIYLNRANNTIGWMKVSSGGITSTIVDQRIVLGTALKAAACGMILAHNHPSGNLSPSQQDFDLTKKIKSAATFMDITIIDHLIVNSEGYYSFADEGQI